MDSAPDSATRAIFDAAPWTALPRAEMGAAARVPTMLTEVEQALYFWLARDWARGQGEIVDLGCFAGGSTARLAEGRRQAGHAPRLHAYDRFTASAGVKQRVLYPAGVPRFDGHDILPLARRVLAPWAAQVTLHPGEIEDHDWSGAPIEILALDASKSTAAMDRMAEMFFPSLIPGASVVIQQDYFHWRQPWVPVQMERLAGHFAPLAPCPDGTMLFLCTAPVDAAALARGACDGLSDDEMLQGVAAARARLARFGRDARFERMIAGLRANPGERVAWRLQAPAD